MGRKTSQGATSHRRGVSPRDAFTAVADPTRRRILDILHRRRTLSAGEIARRFSDASRPGISRHLGVLRECGVVSVERVGRAQLYSLRIAPLLQMRDGWLAKFGDMQRHSLSALRAKVEEES